MNQPLKLQFENVTYQVGETTLVSDLNFEIRQGETLVLLGRSGSGKTTTLRLINGLLIPQAGEVRIDGVSTEKCDRIKLRRRIGYVIQEVGLFPHLSVAGNVGLLPSLEGWTSSAIEDRSRELLGMLELEPDQFADRYPHELSGGQRQRVGLARALATDPPVLLMDEPFGALDPLTRVQIRRQFQRLQEKLKKTVVLVTHDVQEALVLATQIGLMREGRLVALGTTEDFLKSREPEARAYVESLHSINSTAGLNPGG